MKYLTNLLQKHIKVFLEYNPKVCSFLIPNSCLYYNKLLFFSQSDFGY